MADKKPPAQVVRLNTLHMHGKVQPVGQNWLDTSQGSRDKRVFTDDEWAFLNTRTNADLWHRITQGHRLIGLLYRPEMMNMTPKEADMRSSNLRYQIDAILSIIRSRASQVEG